MFNLFWVENTLLGGIWLTLSNRRDIKQAYVDVATWDCSTQRDFPPRPLAPFNDALHKLAEPVSGKAAPVDLIIPYYGIHAGSSCRH